VRHRPQSVPSNFNDNNLVIPLNIIGFGHCDSLHFLKGNTVKMTIGKQYSDWEHAINTGSAAIVHFYHNHICHASSVGCLCTTLGDDDNKDSRGEFEVQCALDLIYRKLFKKVIDVVQLVRAGAVGLTRV
jgi:hypothetical protein